MNSTNRAAYDHFNICKLLDLVDIDVYGLLHWRMGNRSYNRPRPVKVVFPCATIQRRFLHRIGRALPQSDFYRVKIRPSLSREQRHAEYLLREERRKRKHGSSTANWDGRPMTAADVEAFRTGRFYFNPASPQPPAASHSLSPSHTTAISPPPSVDTPRKSSLIRSCSSPNIALSISSSSAPSLPLPLASLPQPPINNIPTLSKPIASRPSTVTAFPLSSLSSTIPPSSLSSAHPLSSLSSLSSTHSPTLPTSSLSALPPRPPILSSSTTCMPCSSTPSACPPLSTAAAPSKIPTAQPKKGRSKQKSPKAKN